jgi:pimeloyl-ACP methyl ester carboxylesterase
MADVLEAAGHRLEIDRLAGAAPTLVFLHEGLGCVARWRDFPREVARATGRAALVYSRRGYGQSDPVPLPRPLDFMHDEARRVLPALLEAAQIDDAILIGHSDGASIALIYAGENGRAIRGVVAMAPHVMVEDICVTSIAKIRREYADPSARIRERLAKTHADVDGAFYGWADAWLDPGFRAWDLRSILPGVKVPVMVIQGEEDEYGTTAQVDEVCARVSGRAERVILSGCGHSPQRDRPKETLEAIVRFVTAWTG